MESSRRKPRQTTPSQDVPESVVITRAGHPFEGLRLQVISRRQRAGRPHLLLLLPDQSRGLIPVDWTDFIADVVGTAPASDVLGSLADLLHARVIIDALLRQTEQESNDATEPGLRGSAARRQSIGATRRSDTRNDDRSARAGDRKGRNRKSSKRTGAQR